MAKAESSIEITLTLTAGEAQYLMGLLQNAPGVILDDEYPEDRRHRESIFIALNRFRQQLGY